MKTKQRKTKQRKARKRKKQKGEILGATSFASVRGCWISTGGGRATQPWAEQGHSSSDRWRPAMVLRLAAGVANSDTYRGQPASVRDGIVLVGGFRAWWRRSPTDTDVVHILLIVDIKFPDLWNLLLFCFQMNHEIDFYVTFPRF